MAQPAEMGNGGNFILGVSSGLFKLADQEAKFEYIGIAHKALYSTFKGVTFTQVDVESIAEFQEPQLKEKLEQVKRMGIEFGIHGEAKEYTETLPILDSALEEQYKRSHERMMYSLKGAGNIGSKYFLLHSSSSTPFVSLWHDLQPTIIVDVWGRRIGEEFANENPDVIDWASNQDFVMENVRESRRLYTVEEYMQTWENEYKKENKKEPSESEKKSKRPEFEKLVKENYVNAIKDFTTTQGVTYGTEKVAYYIIAKWMQDGRTCPQELQRIWKEITNGGDVTKEKWREEKGGANWVPAVTAAYLWGHVNPDRCPKKQEGIEDPKPILEKYKMFFAFETPMATGEETLRLGRVSHIVTMVKNMNSPWCCVANDAEHQLSALIDPVEDIKKNLKFGDGRWVKVIHTGYPSPLAPAHMPIPLGSEAQMYVYNLLWELRKKGFEEGWIIFERAGGQEPVKESILSLRQIVKYLKMGIPPDKLDEEFFGIKPEGPETSRQWVNIKDHVMEPIKGLLVIPEEEYGFLSTAAAAKGKLEEWKKEKLK